ncbi:MAG: tripartite tricarboxylate transporter substrate binding protein [Burkholderiaceae bacterium]|nr:tripartite tricarboxylate transporter substrate binding protein [Burkholderiaceae bacterium]
MLTLTAGVLASASMAVQAADYPSKPVNLVVGYSAGGATDRVARIIARELTSQTGQPFIVENRPGANSNIAAAYVAGQQPDGYTIFVGSVANTISRSLYSNLQYDLLKDLKPIVLLTTISNILVVHPDLPVNSVKEYIEYAKANPGKLTCASSGVGSSIHLSCELFKMQTGTDILHIPYKGSAPAVADLVGGQVDSMFDNLPSAIPQVRGGKLKALAVTANEPVPFAPGVPTVIESGVEGFEVSSWFGLYAPAGTPQAIIDKLNADVNKALTSPSVIQAYEEAGFMMPAKPNSVADLANKTQVEVDKWQAVIESANLKMD